MDTFQKWIAFSGSASATAGMVRYAEAAIQRAMIHNWSIMVGDTPQGIDRAIVSALLDASYPYFFIATIQNEAPRVLTALRGGNPKSKGTWQDHHLRDRTMVEFADTVMCIWNGKSKGTKAVFDYAIEVGAEAYLVDFSRQDRKAKRAPLLIHVEEKQPEQAVLFGYVESP